METDECFNVLLDSVALIYHESRNVRHLVNGKWLSPEPWRNIISLPTNREDAWHEIAPLRDKALQATNLDQALKIFETRFRRSLPELEELFSNSNWKHAKLYGGNAWVNITKLAIALANALRNRD